MNNTPRYRIAPVTLTGSGDNLVLSSTSSPINIYGIVLVATSPVSIIFKNGTANALSGSIFLNTGGSINLDPVGVVRYICGSGSGTGGGFYINLSGAVTVGGTVYYTYGGL